MANNSKDIYKQLEEMIIKCDNLSRKYENKINELKMEIAELKKENQTLRAKNEELLNEVDRLKKQIDKDSSNSSKPPSSDINKKVIVNNREKSKKSKGAQKGHTGYSLSKKAIEDKIKDGSIQHEIKNHGEANPNAKYVSKYVIEVKVETIATEHRFYPNEQGKIIIPKEFHTDVQYGSSVKTICAMLNTLEVVAIDRLKDFISAITNDTIKLSTGTIINFIKELSDKSSSYITSMTEKILNSSILYTDATTSKYNSKKIYFRNYSDDKHTVYTANTSKSKKSIEDDGILSRYVGTIVHDHETLIYNYGTSHAECNVHILRYLKANLQNTNNNWSKDLISFLCCLNQYRKKLKSENINCLPKCKLDKYSIKYDEILEKGFIQNKSTKPSWAKKDEKKLLNRLKKYKNNHLLFLYNFDVSFDNNLSERELRPIKTKTKVSGCFRSTEGAKWFANIRSIITTCIKQGIDIFSTIQSIYQETLINL